MAEFRWTCDKCGVEVARTDLDEFKSALEAHKASCPGPGKPVRDIKEVVPEEAVRGNLITIEEVLEREIVVEDFELRASAFREDQQYLSMKIRLGGEEFTLNTGAARILTAFQFLKKEDLPVKMTIEQVKLPGGRRVYRIK